MRIAFHGLTVVAFAVFTANAANQPLAMSNPGHPGSEAAKPVAALSGAWVVTSATRDAKAGNHAITCRTKVLLRT